MKILETILSTRFLLTALILFSCFFYTYYFIIIQISPATIRVASSNRQLISEELLKYVVEKNHAYPNLPLNIWDTLKKDHEDGCTRIPEIYDLNFNNDYWQKLQTTNGTFYLYGAYFDTRPTLTQRRVVRILSLIDRYKPTVKTFCHLWFENITAGVVAPVYKYEYLWKKEFTHSENGDLQPYLLACEVPKSIHFAIPIVVSLVETPCSDAKTSLLVHYNKLPKNEKQENFAVCVKGLSFLDDRSVRIVEWLELMYEMGVSKVFLYKFEVHLNIEKTLHYYETMGKVEVIPISHPADEPNIPKIRKLYHNNRVAIQWQNELIPYHDCFYRNMYKYKYISLLDTDEIIVPNRTNNWYFLLKELTNNEKMLHSSYCFQNVFFMGSLQPWNVAREIPGYMFMFRTTGRHIFHSIKGNHVKCIHNTKEILSLHNHYPFKCLGGNCNILNVSNDVAHLQHYRQQCSKISDELCPNENNAVLVDDFTIWKYKDKLIPRVFKVVQYLHLLK